LRGPPAGRPGLPTCRQAGREARPEAPSVRKTDSYGARPPTRNGLAKANSRPTATLMMNAASIRPAVMNMRTCSTGISSGWRAADSRNLPAMMARPRPAPSAARPIMMPMARTVEAWTEARAVSAVSMVFSETTSLVRVKDCVERKRNSVRVFRQAQVDDRQHHEDEGLQRDHEDVEDHPAQPEQRAAEQAQDAGAAEHPDQQEHDLAAEHVAEQSHRQRDRLAQPLDDVEDQVERHHPLAERRHQEFLGEAAQALGAQREEQHQEEHADRHAERGAHVGGRHRLPVGHAQQLERLGDEIGRDELHHVHQHDPEEQSDRDRRHQLAGAVVGIARLAVDELEHHLDQRLPLARHAGRGLARGEPEDEHHEQAHGHRADQRVHVDREEATLARLRRKVLQMVLDVAGWGQFRPARHVSTRPVDDTVLDQRRASATIWATSATRVPANTATGGQPAHATAANSTANTTNHFTATPARIRNSAVVPGPTPPPSARRVDSQPPAMIATPPASTPSDHAPPRISSAATAARAVAITWGTTACASARR